jgi:hypothetical protein
MAQWRPKALAEQAAPGARVNLAWRELRGVPSTPYCVELRKLTLLPLVQQAETKMVSHLASPRRKAERERLRGPKAP